MNTCYWCGTSTSTQWIPNVLPNGQRVLSCFHCDEGLTGGQFSKAAPSSQQTSLPPSMMVAEERRGMQPVERLLSMPEAIPPPPGAKALAYQSDKERSGRCYKYAGLFIFSNRGWTLVHGGIYPLTGRHQDKLYDHAWCERDDVVFEPNANQFYRKDDFYRAYRPKVRRTYSWADAMRMMGDTKKWGPWR